MLFSVVMLCDYPEDGGDTFFQNIGNYLQDHTPSLPKRPQMTTSTKTALQIIHTETYSFASSI
jgi:hypothetical protein